MKKLWFTLVMAVFLSAAPALAQEDAAAALTAAGCGPSEQLFKVKTTDLQHPMGKPEPGKALVYFFVDYEGAFTMRVGVDGSWVGANNGKSYFFFQVSPGQHNLCTEESDDFKKSTQRVGEAMQLNAVAGETYYVRLNFGFQKMSIDTQWMHLELADEAEGHYLIGSSLYATSQLKK